MERWQCLGLAGKMRLKENPNSFRAFAPYGPALRPKRLRPTLTHYGRKEKLILMGLTIPIIIIIFML